MPILKALVKLGSTLHLSWATSLVKDDYKSHVQGRFSGPEVTRDQVKTSIGTQFAPAPLVHTRPTSVAEVEAPTFARSLEIRLACDGRAVWALLPGGPGSAAVLPARASPILILKPASGVLADGFSEFTA